MDFTTLIADKGTAGSIRSWLNWDELPSESILEEAQAYIYTLLRVRETRKLLEDTLGAGESSLTLPEDFREPIRFRFLASNPGLVSILPPDRFDERLVFSGSVLPTSVPTEATLDASEMRFNAIANTNLTFRFWYTAKIPNLSAGNPRNFLTDRYPNILRAACMYEATNYYKREDRDHWLGQLTALIEAANAELSVSIEAEGASSAMSFSTLVGPMNRAGSIRSFVQDESVPAEIVLAEAQALIYSRIRCREMKARTTLSLSVGASTVTLPLDYREALLFKMITPWSGRVRIHDAELFASRLGRDEDGELLEGPPSECWIDGTTIHFNTKADQAYSFELWYWKTPASLTSGSPTNFLTTRYPHVLREACLAQGYLFADKMDQHAAALERLMNHIGQVNAEYDLSHQAEEREIHWGRD